MWHFLLVPLFPNLSVHLESFILVMVLFSSLISIWFLFVISVYCICFKRISNCVLKFFLMITALKSSSDNSNMWFIFMLVSVDCLFLIQVVIFIVLSMMSDFFFTVPRTFWIFTLWDFESYLIFLADVPLVKLIWGHWHHSGKNEALIYTVSLKTVG